MTFAYLKKFLLGEKQLYKKQEIKYLETIPHFEEFSVKNIWNQYKNDHFVLTYHPIVRLNNLPDRKYLMNIINTIYTGRIHNLIKKAIELRALIKMKGKTEKEKTIQVSDEISRIIFSSNMVSGK